MPDPTPRMDFSVISIGTLAANPLWGERDPVRTGHATTTLIRAGDTAILVDPGLPAPALAARLGERANLTPDDITHVFLTSFHPDVRRGLSLFPDAPWLIHEHEREGVGVPLAAQLKHLLEAREPGQAQDAVDALRHDIALLQRCTPAHDTLAENVTLFPLPGVSPGLCGLLLEHPRFTVLLAGDAIPTREHADQGKLLPSAADLDRARQSFEEAIEVADLIIPGRDNLFPNPTRRPF